MNAQPIAAATDAISRAELAEERRRDAATFRRRLICRIDQALDQCELRNLAGDRTPPTEAVELVVWLQEAAEAVIRRPITTQETLDQLFALQDAYLAGASAEDDEENLHEPVARPPASALAPSTVVWRSVAGRHRGQLVDSRGVVVWGCPHRHRDAAAAGACARGQLARFRMAGDVDR